MKDQTIGSNIDRLAGPSDAGTQRGTHADAPSQAALTRGYSKVGQPAPKNWWDTPPMQEFGGVCGRPHGWER